METKSATTCQICGRPIKANTGVIAHHGYQRPGNGWQTSSCMGARHLPYEQSCDLIPKAIASITEYINRMNTTLEEYKTTPPDYLLYYPYRGAGRKTEGVKVERPADFKVDGHYVSVPGSYNVLYKDACYELEQKVKFAKHDLDFLTKRLADWKPPVQAIAS